MSNTPIWPREMEDPTLINAINAALPFGTITLPPLDLSVDGALLVAELTVEDAVLGAGDIIIDWGDETTSRLSGNDTIEHEYEEAGEYTISAHNTLGQADTITFEAEDV